jgi:hypothetical protein
MGTPGQAIPGGNRTPFRAGMALAKRPMDPREKIEPIVCHFGKFVPFLDIGLAAAVATPNPGILRAQNTG